VGYSYAPSTLSSKKKKKKKKVKVDYQVTKVEPFNELSYIDANPLKNIFYKPEKN
jgi:glutamine cyclotransferase